LVARFEVLMASAASSLGEQEMEPETAVTVDSSFSNTPG